MHNVFLKTLVMALMLSLAGCADSPYIYHRATINQYPAIGNKADLVVNLNRLVYTKGNTRQPQVDAKLKASMETSLAGCVRNALGPHSPYRVTETGELVNGDKGNASYPLPGFEQDAAMIEFFNQSSAATGNRYLVSINMDYQESEAQDEIRSASLPQGNVYGFSSSQLTTTTILLSSRILDLQHSKRLAEIDLNGWGKDEKGGGIAMLFLVVPVPFPYVSSDHTYYNVCNRFGELLSEYLAGELKAKN